MSKVVLDASALLALIKGEPGSEVVESLLGNIIMSSINVSEAAAVIMNTGMSAGDCQECIHPFITSIIDFNTQQAFKVAELRALTKDKGLSLGDRACLALGIQLRLPIYTADHNWKEIQLSKAEIILIR